MPSTRLAGVAAVLGAFVLSACVSKTVPSPTVLTSDARVLPAPRVAPSAAKAAPAAPIATGSGPMNLDAAVRRAVAWHPSIKESVGRLQQEGEAVNEARSGYLPRLNWGVDSSYDKDDGYRPMASVSGSQMIYDFGKVDGRIRVATAGVSGRRSQVLAAVDLTARDTANAFVEIRRGQALKRVAQDQLADVREIMDLVQSRTDLGASTESDQLQAQSRVEAGEATLLEIESQVSRAQVSLAALVGTSGRIDAKAGLPRWLDKACAAGTPDLSRVPAIQQAEAERDAATAEIDLSRAEGLPTISLDARMGHDLTGLDFGDSEYGAGVNVRGSLYNGGETAARRKAALHALDASGAAADRTRLDIEARLAEASSQISSLRALQRSLSTREDMMRRTRGLYQMQYIELGTRSLLDVLNATEELHAARFDRLNVEYDLYKLGVDCAYVTGRMRDVFSLQGQTVQGLVL